MINSNNSREFYEHAGENIFAYIIALFILVVPVLPDYAYYKVTGNSTNPFLKDGSIVKVKKGKWKDGDIVVEVVKDSGKTIVKRLKGDKKRGVFELPFFMYYFV